VVLRAEDRLDRRRGAIGRTAFPVFMTNTKGEPAA